MLNEYNVGITQVQFLVSGYRKGNSWMLNSILRV